MSDMGVQLREKQKARQIYGVLERQFRRYFSEALRRPGVTGQSLLQILEQRLDNVVYRLSFADSRSQARQLVTHGHFLVNGKKVDIPSYRVKPKDFIAWRENSRNKEVFKILTSGAPRRLVPSWLALDSTEMTGQIASWPETSDIDIGVDSRLIVEHYSR
jgi:small subunit ribosomal protein S4